MVIESLSTTSQSGTCPAPVPSQLSNCAKKNARPAPVLTADTSTTYTVSDNSSTDALFAALQAHPSAVPFGIQAIRSGMIAPDGQTAYFCTERNVHCLNISRNSTSLARQISGSARWDYQSLTLSQDGRWLLAVSFGRLHNGGVIEGPDPDNAYQPVEERSFSCGEAIGGGGYGESDLESMIG